MSHVASVDLTFNNINAIKKVCDRMPELSYCGKGFVKFYDDTEVGGHILNFEGWKYPAVIQPDGTLYFDTYKGEWGDEKLLNKFKQLYAIETAKVEAEIKGYQYQEETLPSGVLKLTISV